MLRRSIFHPGLLAIVLGLPTGLGASDGAVASAVGHQVSAPVQSVATAAAAEAVAFGQDTAIRLSQGVIGKPVGDYELTDRAGRRIRLAQYRGKPLLVNFIYTGCSQVCPTSVQFLSQAVNQAQRTLGADSFSTLTIGFNAPDDTPLAMADFARRQGIRAPNWEFAGAQPETVTQLTRDFGFSYAATTGGFDHIAQVTVVDAAGRVYRQVYGDSFELPLLVEPLRALVTGTPQPELSVAQVLDRIRVLCTVYDPASGKYRLNYALFIEIFAGLTVIGGTVLFLLRERRRRLHGR